MTSVSNQPMKNLKTWEFRQSFRLEMPWLFYSLKVLVSKSEFHFAKTMNKGLNKLCNKQRILVINLTKNFYDEIMYLRKTEPNSKIN